MVFGIWAANLWTFREKFLLALSKLQSPLLRNRFWWKKNFVQKIVNSISSKFGRVFLIFANEVTTGLSRLRCFCSNDHFNKEVFRIAYKFFLISGIPARSFQVLTRKSWQDGHNYLLHAQKHNLRKKNFLPENSYFLCSFVGIWVTNLWFFREKILVGLSKVHSPLLGKNHFWWKQILIKKL